MGYNASEFVGGSYLKGDDLKESGPQLFTIEDVTVSEFDGKGKKEGQKERRLNLVFTTGQSITLNNTNGKELVKAFGGKTDGWIGRDIIAYFDPTVMFGAKRVGGVRVRLPKPAAESTEFPG